MKTCTYLQVVSLAAQLAGRTDDTTSGGLRLPPSEATMLLTFFAAELPDIWNREAWPELCDHIEAVTLDANGCFSLREGTATEIGDILAVIVGGDPRTTTRVRTLPRDQVTRLEGRANILAATTETPIYVDWQTPPTDLLAIAAGSLDATTLPLRFKLALAARGAALLLAEEDPQRALLLRALAENDLNKQASRLERPWWRR